MGKDMEACVTWILTVSLSPIALLVIVLIAMLKWLQFICKAALLFVITGINTPFAVAYNVSLLVFHFMVDRVRYSDWNWVDPRANVGIELQLLVSDFFKVIAGELLLVLSTGVITFYTTPRLVFFISLAVGVTAILLKWLNTNSLSKTAFSCLCDGIGLSPIMFFFSFIGLFDIGCHPIAKCSFTANQAFLFTSNEPHPFAGQVTDLRNRSIEFENWNAFERGFFQLSPRIDFVSRNSNRKFILKSFMVLKMHNRNVKLCDYPVQRLELPEDYSKVKELLNFLHILAQTDGFVTNRMRGRYEHSLTLLEITEGVQLHDGYRFINPFDARFVVAGCSI